MISRDGTVPYRLPRDDPTVPSHEGTRDALEAMWMPPKGRDMEGRQPTARVTHVTGHLKLVQSQHGGTA